MRVAIIGMVLWWSKFASTPGADESPQVAAAEQKKKHQDNNPPVPALRIKLIEVAHDVKSGPSGPNRKKKTGDRHPARRQR